MEEFCSFKIAKHYSRRLSGNFLAVKFEEDYNNEIKVEFHEHRKSPIDS